MPVYQQQYPNFNYSNYTQQIPMQSQRMPYVDTQRQASFGLKGRPVASIEEARASMIDFDGSVFYFPDPANRRIYTKQINLDGTASLNTYEFVEIPTTQNVDPSYVSQEEFQNTINIVLGEIEKIKGVTENEHE